MNEVTRCEDGTYKMAHTPKRRFLLGEKHLAAVSYKSHKGLALTWGTYVDVKSFLTIKKARDLVAWITRFLAEHDPCEASVAITKTKSAARTVLREQDKITLLSESK